MSELRTTELCESLRHLIEHATQGMSPTPLFLIGHAELVAEWAAASLETITSLEKRRDNAASKNQQDKIRLINQMIETLSWPRQLAAVLSPRKV